MTNKTKLIPKAISYTFLKQNLSSVLDKIEKDQEVYFVSRKKHSDVVMLSKKN